VRGFLKPLALSVAALASALSGGAQLATAGPAFTNRREDIAGAASRTPEEFVIARNSSVSGGMLAHSSHASHSSHSSHYSSSSPSAPYTPSPTTDTPAAPATLTPTTPPYSVEIVTPKPAPQKRAQAIGTWSSLTVVHVEELTPFHHNIELSDGHVYSVANKVVDWTPGDAVQIHAERSKTSGRKYYTLKSNGGQKFEARRIH
jgi:hypothetical protein